METLRNTAGFFGPSLLTDITLVVQIIFYLVLSAGVVAQLLQKYKLHDMLQTPVVVLNLFFIYFVMVPTFRNLSGDLSTTLVQPPIMVTTIHAVLGATAQLISIYCLLAGLNILPRKIGVLRYWMWAAYTTWTAALIFGIVVYILFYATAPVATPPVDADTVLETPPPVDEHAEPLPEVTPTATRVVPLATATESVPTATVTLQATAPLTPTETIPATDETTPAPLPTETPAPAETATPSPTETPTVAVQPEPTEEPAPAATDTPASAETATATPELLDPEPTDESVSEHDGG